MYITEDQYVRGLVDEALWTLQSEVGTLELRPLPPWKTHDKANHWNLVKPTGGFTPGPDGLFIDDAGRFLVVLEAKLDGTRCGEADSSSARSTKRGDAFGRGWGYAVQAHLLLQSANPTLYGSGSVKNAVGLEQLLGLSIERVKALEVIPALLSLQTGDEAKLSLDEVAHQAALGHCKLRSGLAKTKWMFELPLDKHPSTGFRWAVGHVKEPSANRVVLSV